MVEEGLSELVPMQWTLFFVYQPNLCNPHLRLQMLESSTWGECDSGLEWWWLMQKACGGKFILLRMD
jgi:hypothetical protein